MKSIVSRSPVGARLAIVLATLILLVPALINRFPFMFVDSLDYVILTPRLYRSPFYQLFVFGTGFKHFVWLPILCQAALCSLLVWYLMATAAIRGAGRYLIVVAILSSFGSLAIFVGFMMPDVFTGAMFVCIYLLAFRWRRLGSVDRLLIAAFTLLCIAVHLSHLVMAAAMIGACALTRLAGLRWIDWRGVATGASCTALVAGLIILYNSAVFGVAALSPAGSTFLLANLIEYGPARAELRETCPRAGYRLCGYVDKLPPLANSFLWTDGPFRKLGGFVGLRDESSRVVAATLRHRPLAIASVSLRNTGRALMTVLPTTDIIPVDPRYKPIDTLTTVYGADAGAAYAGSRQGMNRFPRGTYDRMTVIGLVAAIAVLLALGTWSVIAGRARLLSFPLFSVAAFVGNAATCATLSGVFDRYQSRTSWLLVAAALLLALNVRDHRRSSARRRPSRGLTPSLLHAPARAPM